MTEKRKLELISLFSGSKGNSTLVRSGEISVLVDAGGSAKAIEKCLFDLGMSFSELSAIFITHEHCDHTHALPVISKKYKTPIHMTKASAEALLKGGEDSLPENIITHDGEFTVKLGKLTAEAFITPHDSVQCVGYRFSEGGYSVGIATDLGYVTQRVYDMLFGCDTVMLESNHDREMVKNGRYAEALKRRILSNGGHLSNDACAEIAAALARSGTKGFMLAHLSKENNTRETALEVVSRALSEYGSEIVVCEQDKITTFF